MYKKSLTPVLLSDFNNRLSSQAYWYLTHFIVTKPGTGKGLKEVTWGWSYDGVQMRGNLRPTNLALFQEQRRKKNSHFAFLT